jgi:aldehyde dehydrogenase (NAD+)
VCALITPWNWPMNQVAAKVVPALAAGCTMVLKPSEYSPFSAILWAKVMHEAGVPAGVFNLINGDGPASARRSPRIAMSTWCPSPARPAPAPRSRAMRPPRSSACIRSSAASRRTCCSTTPTSSARSSKACCTCFRTPASPAMRRRACWCPRRKIAEVEAIAQAHHRDRGGRRSGFGEDHRRPAGVQDCSSIASRATSRRASPKARSSSPAAPAGRRGLTKGYYVKPTIFSNVRNDMTIAREEIFGPVLCILPYQTEEQAMQIANDTPYGLAAYVWSQDNVRARASATASAPARSRSTAPRATCRRPSAASRCPATGANTASSACAISWRSRR